MCLFKSKPKNTANVKNLQYIPTWKLEAILEHPNTQGIDGRDYGPVKEELEQILFERKNRLQEWTLRKQMHGLDRAIREQGPNGIKPVKVETAVTPSQSVKEVATDLIVEINEFWKITRSNGGYELLAIPPQIMAF